MQSNPRILVNLLVQLPRKNPLRFMGGAWGGPTPYRASPGCILKVNQGNKLKVTSLWVPWEPTQCGGNGGVGSGYGGWPRGPMAPLLGGEIHSREGSHMGG